MPDAALARYPVVGDEVKCRHNIRIFLDAFNEHHGSPSPALLVEPQFSDDDHVANFQDCVDPQTEAKIDRFVVKYKARERLYPLHRESVLAEMDRCRWLAWGTQDHLIFYERPRILSIGMEEVWNGHRIRGM